MPAVTACLMTVDWALPSDCSEAKTRRASTPQAPTSVIRWFHRLDGADIPTTLTGIGEMGVADCAGELERTVVATARPATRETKARFMGDFLGGVGG